MPANLVVFAIFLTFVIVLIFRSIKIVPATKKMIVSRLGRFHAVHNSGMAVLVPFIDKGTLVDMQRQTIELKIDKASILDSSPVNLTIQIGYSVVDPAKATLNVADYKSAILTLSETQVRNNCSEATLTEVLAERPKLQEKIRDAVNASAREWGINVDDLVISFVDVDENVQHELRRKAEAERLRRLMTE